MDENTMLLIVAVAGVALLIVAMAIFRRSKSFKAWFKGPGGIEANIEATNPPPSKPGGVSIEDATSRQGKVEAIDETGQGARIRGADAAGDVRAISSDAPRDESDPKKA